MQFKSARVLTGEKLLLPIHPRFEALTRRLPNADSQAYSDKWIVILLTDYCYVGFTRDNIIMKTLYIQACPLQEEKLAPSTEEPDSGAADPIKAGAIASTSPAIPTKIDTQATAEPATAEPDTTTSRGVGTGGTAVPIPIPIVVPVSGSQHNKDLSQDEAADLPPLKDASDLPSASPGSTAVVGGVMALPAGNSKSSTTKATEEAPAATAAESNIAGGAVLPGAAAAEAQKETAPVYEEPIVGSTGGADSLAEGFATSS